MSDEKKTIRIELTTEQQSLVKERTGKEVQAVELTAGEELEKRIAPESISIVYGSQHITY